ncbi:MULTISPECIES: hypothetical protein [unclassified Chryseobacterium]|uniref:hypothetical protein n=1 Tax=unclassified Chryseobacterium TaxID=2593645 RepID=UPI0030173617
MKFETYELKITDNEDLSCSIKLEPNTGVALIKERRKLYIIHYNNEIFYVGEAHTSMKIRLLRGCNAYNYYKNNNDIARNGYKGYKWLDNDKNPKRNLTVNVVTFTKEYDNRREVIEAIEGELVYLIRNKLGYWPKFQNEIHFSNNFEATELAISIFSKISYL